MGQLHHHHMVGVDHGLFNQQLNRRVGVVENYQIVAVVADHGARVGPAGARAQIQRVQGIAINRHLMLGYSGV